MRGRPPNRGARIAAIAMLGLAPGPCLAQALFEQFNFQFSFSTPGGRSKGMGQAFTAVADDATAPETNPGALARGVQVREAAAEFSAIRTITRRAARADAFERGSSATFGDRVYSPSFVGVVVCPREGLAVTAFRHQFLNYRESFRLERRAVPGTSLVFLPTDGRTDLAGESFGLGLGWRVHPRAGLGVSVKLERIAMRTLTHRSDIFDPSLVVNVQEIDDSDWAPGFVVGGVWAPLRKHPKIRLGVAYSFNPRFRLEERFDTVAGGQRTPVEGYPRKLEIDLPDRLSLGVAAARGPVTAALDVVFESYSQLGGATSTLLPQVGELPRKDFTIRDVWSVHAGVDWMLGGIPTKTRLLAGVFTAPSHAYRYKGETSSPSGRALDYAFNGRPESTALGWSIGVGRSFGSAIDPKLKATLSWRMAPGQLNEAVISLVLPRW